MIKLISEADQDFIQRAKSAAMDVMLNNAEGPFQSLPRAAAWGYPEPYTRDMLISLLGVLASRNTKLVGVFKKVLMMLAQNQSPLGHIPSLVHNPEDRGASDTTPLFLMGVSIYRKATGDMTFLENAVQTSLTWMKYQSPTNRSLIAQLPTSDWRDEQWVLGYGLYVNCITYLSLIRLNIGAL